MTTDQEPGSANPLDQLNQTMEAVNEALRSAGNNALASNQQLTQFAIGHAKENIGDLLKALQTISATSKPTEIAEIYAGFMRDAAKKQADHLVAMGEILAQNSQAAWRPIATAIASAAKGKKG